MRFKNYAKNFCNLTLAAILSLNMSYAQSVEIQQSKVQLLKAHILENNQQSGETADGVIASVNKFRVSDYLFDLSVTNDSLNINYVNNFVAYLTEEKGSLIDNGLDGVLDDGSSRVIEKEFFPKDKIISEETTNFNEENKILFQQKYDNLVDTLLSVFEKRKNVDAINANVNSSIHEKANKVARYVRFLGEDNGWSCDFSFEKGGMEYLIKGFFDHDLPSITIYKFPIFRSIEKESVSATDRYIDGLSDAGEDFVKNSKYSYDRTKNFNEFRNEGLEHKEFFQTEYERLLDIVLNRFAALKINEVTIHKFKK